mgnify:FL=1
MENTILTTKAIEPRTLPQVHRAVLKIIKRLNPGAAVLDAPCGEGALLLRLQELGFKARGLDIDPLPSSSEKIQSQTAH